MPELRKSLNFSKGFTLIELLLVIGLIGILSGVLLTVIDSDQQRAIAEDAVKRDNLEKVAQSIEAFSVSEGFYPGIAFNYAPNQKDTPLAFLYHQIFPVVYAVPGPPAPPPSIEGINPLVDSPDADALSVYLKTWPDEFWYNFDTTSEDFSVHVKKSTNDDYFKYSSVWGEIKECAYTMLIDVTSCPDPNGSTTPVCGDNTCNGTETCTTCAQDCGACGPVPQCPNGVCSNGETCTTCPADCGSCGPVPQCPNGVCSNGETCTTCPADCGSCGPVPQCPNGVCSNGETCTTCPADCGSCGPVIPACGDGTCNGTETCTTCASDCGSCGPVICGNGICSGGETCTTCSRDCGKC